MREGVACWEPGSSSGLAEQTVHEMVVAGMKGQDREGPETKGRAQNSTEGSGKPLKDPTGKEGDVIRCALQGRQFGSSLEDGSERGK